MIDQIRPLMIRFFAAALLTVAVASAQDGSPVFRTGTTLVEFTIIALDGKGNPISDLKPEEITIRENNGNRELAFFRFEGGEQAETGVQLPAGAFTNRPELAPGQPRNVTAILLDSLNTAPEDQVYARAQVMRLMRQVAPDTRVAVYLLGSDLRVLHDFSDDPQSLRESVAATKSGLALQATDDLATLAADAQAFNESLKGIMRSSAVTGQTAMLEVSQMANQLSSERRSRRTLASIEALGDHLVGIPGRKSIVWITGGLQMLSVTSGPNGIVKSYEGWMRNTGQKLATQGIAMYAVDARGNHGPTTNAGFEARKGRTIGEDRGRQGIFEEPKMASAISSDPLAALEKLAELTGGRAIFHTNDLTRGIRAVASDLKGAYSLAFYSAEAPDGKWREIGVKVSRRGVKLRHAEGYLAEAPANTARPWTDSEWSAAVISPITATSLAIDARGSLSSKTDVNELTLAVQFDASALHFRSSGRGARTAYVELAFADKAADGTFTITRQPLQLPYDVEHPNQPFQASHAWKLAPGVATVRVIVHDQLTGQFGTLDLPVSRLPRLPGKSNN